MLVVGDIVPTFFIIYISVNGLIVALPKFTAEGFWVLTMLWAQVVILGGLLYLAAYGITWFLFRILPHRYALLVLIGLIATLFMASTFEIYRMPGHNSSPPANILRIFKSLATQSGKGELLTPPPHTTPDHVRDGLRVRVLSDHLCHTALTLALSSAHSVARTFIPRTRHFLQTPPHGGTLAFG
jgi:hypothetical protein